MRIHFASVGRVKKSVKFLAAQIDAPHARVLEVVAKVCGFRDWHDMAGVLSSQESRSNNDSPSTDQLIRLHVSTASALMSEFGLTSSTALYAVAASLLLPFRRLTAGEQLTAQVALWRVGEIPISQRREKGAVGRVLGEPAILRRFGRPTRYISHKSADSGCADFEFVSPRSPAELFVPMRLYLPYGTVCEPDGAEVLFSRDYLPLWRLRPDRRPERLEPWETLPGGDRIWFWDDVSTPWRVASTYERELARLESMRLPSLPALTDVLPVLLERDDITDFSDAVRYLMDRRTSRVPA